MKKLINWQKWDVQNFEAATILARTSAPGSLAMVWANLILAKPTPNPRTGQQSLRLGA